jgi:hypothetical protein
MVRLQHKIRRDGIISIGGVQYKLDQDGVVEVSEDHAKKLRQGSMWRPPGSWGVKVAAAVAPPPSKSGARRPRTKDEIIAVAESEGIAVPPAKEKVSTEETEVIEVSPDMRKVELVKVARRLGLRVDGKTKHEILELIKGLEN